MVIMLNGIVVDHDPQIRKAGGLLILGGGRDVWADYLSAKEILEHYEVMCVNDIAIHFSVEPLHHAVSMHKKVLSAIRTIRREKSYLERVHTHSVKPHLDVDTAWTIQCAGPTSGGFAAQIAVAMGFTKIILCGIPIDNSGHYFDPPDGDSNHSVKFGDKHNIVGWRQLHENNEYARNRLRSMSGRTASIFGEPTIDWARS